jgi:UPF0755 protein
VARPASGHAELSTIASVFLNRLTDPGFRPLGRLQSDPTAGYGCLVDPMLETCADFDGVITPAMLRDANNRYNTYRHAGLPPGPISNPGLAALRAVLLAPKTPYYFFVADGKGRHVFSETHEAHTEAVRRARAKSP